MQVTKTVEETRKQIKQWKKEGKTIGLVPTMGFLRSSVIRSCTRPWMFPIWSLKKGCITTVNFRDCFWIYDVDHINIR